MTYWQVFAYAFFFAFGLRGGWEFLEFNAEMLERWVAKMEAKRDAKLASLNKKQ